MGVIIKYIIKNMCEKKLRTLLILFSITVSCGLFFSSSAIGGTFAQMYIDRISMYYGETDIIIQPTIHSPSQVLSLSRLTSVENVETAAGVFYSNASYKTGAYTRLELTMMGIDFNDLQALNPVAIVEKDELEPFSGMKIVLGKEFCKKYGYHAGDSINMTVNNGLRKFRIAAIVTGGKFVDQSNVAIVPAETVSSLYNVRGAFNSIEIKLKDEAAVSETIEKLNQVYRGYSVQEPFSSEDIQNEMENLTIPFLLMTTIVAFMSMFIIFTSFKVITMERLPVIGTFRSIGATRKTTDFIMLSESIIYGVIGSGLGVGLGLLILRVMSEMMKSPYITNMKSTVAYTPAQMATSFVFGVVLCFFSSFIPIVQVSRIPLRNIILNTMDKAVKKNAIRLLTGIILVAVSAILPPRVPKAHSFAISTICMLLSVCGFIMLIPYISGMFAKMFEKLYIFLFGNVGILAAKNLRENKSILNNITLLSIGISALMLINIISYSVSVEVADFYSKARYDINYSSYNNNAHTERLLEKMDGVSEAYGFYEISSVEVAGQRTAISTLQGIDYRKYFDYWDFPIHPEYKDKLPELEKERAIFLTNTLKESFEVEAGETMVLKLNDRERKYRVAGFFDSLYNNGSLALISDKYFKVDTGQKNYSAIYIKTETDADEVAQSIQKELSHYAPYTTTVAEMADNNKQSNDQMFMLLKGFSLMAMLIGIVGVVNNLLISFIQRKRQLAIFRSIGMEKGQTVMMISVEALTGGLIGGISGVLSGLLMLYIVQYVLFAIHLPVIMQYPPSTILASGLAGLIIMLVSSVGPSIKSSRLNIVEAIKYE